MALEVLSLNSNCRSTMHALCVPYICVDLGHLHFTGTELKLSYLMMGVASGHSDGHVTLI